MSGWFGGKRERLPLTVFVSHAGADKEIARKTADFLEREVLHVVLDERSFVPGEPLPEQIIERIRAADVVLVLWSEAARERSWVRQEAELALAGGTYLGATIDDAMRHRLGDASWLSRNPGFRRIAESLHPDLAAWTGSRRAAAAQSLLGALRERTSGANRAADSASGLRPEAYLSLHFDHVSQYQVVHGHVARGRGGSKAGCVGVLLSTLDTRFFADAVAVRLQRAAGVQRRGTSSSYAVFLEGSNVPVAFETYLNPALVTVEERLRHELLRAPPRVYFMTARSAQEAVSIARQGAEFFEKVAALQPFVFVVGCEQEIADDASHALPDGWQVLSPAIAEKESVNAWIDTMQNDPDLCPRYRWLEVPGRLRSYADRNELTFGEPIHLGWRRGLEQVLERCCRETIWMEDTQ